MILLLALVSLISVSEVTSQLCGGKEVVNCLIDPCFTAKCSLHPTATCRPNYCGGCNAVFYLNSAKVDCEIINTPCNDVAKKVDESGLLGAFRPQCESNGHYSKRQCHGSTGHCFCVNPKTGEEISGTRKGPNEAHTVKCDIIDTPCHDVAKKVDESGLLGAFRPQCESNGHYSKRQCHGSTGHCFCVNPKTGEEISGTRKGPNEAHTVKCETDGGKRKHKHFPHFGKHFIGGLKNFTGVMKQMKDGKWVKVESLKDQGHHGMKHHVKGKHDDDDDKKKGHHHGMKPHHGKGKGKHHDDHDDDHKGKKHGGKGKHHNDHHKKGKGKHHKHHGHDGKDHHGKRHHGNHKMKKREVIAVVVGGAIMLAIMIAIAVGLYCKKKKMQKKCSVVEYAPDKSSSNPVFEHEMPTEEPPANTAPPSYNEKETRPPSPSPSLPPTYSQSALREVAEAEEEVEPTAPAESRPMETPLPNVDC